MAGRDPERIADTLRRIGEGSIILRLRAGTGRQVPAEMLTMAADEIDRMQNYLLDMAFNLNRVARNSNGLAPIGMLKRANDIRRMVNRRNQP